MKVIFIRDVRFDAIFSLYITILYSIWTSTKPSKPEILSELNGNNSEKCWIFTVLKTVNVDFSYFFKRVFIHRLSS